MMKTYTLTPENLKSITKLDTAFGTTKLLPPLEAIPKEFFESANIYAQLVSDIFYENPLTPWKSNSMQALSKNPLFVACKPISCLLPQNMKTKSPALHSC
jgi:hypothetical protein